MHTYIRYINTYVKNMHYMHCLHSTNMHTTHAHTTAYLYASPNIIGVIKSRMR
jgi:hypothetical protein